jgi:hypothetical protein
MITKEEFIGLILKQQEWSNRVDEVSEALNVPTLFESDWVEYAAILFDKTIDLLFNEDGVDDINWWLYEKSGNPELKMWDADGKEIPTDTVEDLWNLVKDNQK